MAQRSWKSWTLFGLVGIGLIVIAVAGYRWWLGRPLADARAAYARGDWTLALALAQTVYAKEQDTNSRILAARSLCQLTRFEQADAIYRRVPIAQLSTADLRLWGQGLMQLHFWPQALDVYEELVRRSPREPVAIQTVAVLDFQIGKGDEALALAERLAKFPSHQAAAFCIQGAIYESLGESDKAADLFEQVMTLDPSGKSLPVPITEIRQKLILNLYSIGRLDETQQILEDAIATQPNPELISMLGSVLFKKGESEAAREQWLATLRLDERNVRSIMGLGELAMVERQPAEAIEWFRLASDSGAGSSSLEYKLSIAYRQAGRPDLAELHTAEYQRLVEVGDRLDKENRTIFGNPQTPHTLFLLARRALMSGDVLEAEGHLRELQRNFPGYPDASVLSAEIQAKRGSMQSVPNRSSNVTTQPGNN